MIAQFLDYMKCGHQLIGAIEDLRIDTIGFPYLPYIPQPCLSQIAGDTEEKLVHTSRQNFRCVVKAYFRFSLFSRLYHIHFFIFSAANTIYMYYNML